MQWLHEITDNKLSKDATAGFAKDETDAATDLVWPLFADKVVTVEEWASTL